MSKQTPSRKAQNPFRDKREVLTAKINFQCEHTDWWNKEQHDVANNVKEELDLQENGSQLRTQFPKYLEHKLTFKCIVVQLVLTGQFVCLKCTGTWLQGCAGVC